MAGARRRVPRKSQTFLSLLFLSTTIMMVRRVESRDFGAIMMGAEAAFLLHGAGTRASVPSVRRRSRGHRRLGNDAGRLAAVDARGNRPARLRQRQRLGDAEQHRPSDSAALRDRRLLGLPARTGSDEPRARGDDRPAPRERRPRAHAAQRRPRRPGGRDSCSPRWSPTPRRTRASSTFAEAGEDPYRSFLGVPLVDRGLLQGVLVVQTDRAARVRPDDVAACWSWPAPSSHRSSARRGRSASSSRRPISGWRALAQNLWWSWDDGHDQPVPRARSRAVARARQQPGRAAAADADRQARRARVGSWPCTAASTTPTGGCRST